MQIIHLILWLLSSDIFLQVNFNSWSLFRCFPWLVSCTGQACISCHILDLEMFHLRVFSISFSNLFWLGNDTILVCKLYIVYKMKILFLTWPKSWQIYSHCIFNCIFCTFWRLIQSMSSHLNDLILAWSA